MNRILYPALLGGNVLVQPRLIPTSRHAKGGALSSQRVLRFLRNTIRERSDTYVTTFFDLYELPSDFPGAAPIELRDASTRAVFGDYFDTGCMLYASAYCGRLRELGLR